MKKLITVFAFMAAFAVSNAMAARPSAVQGGGSSSSGSSSGGSSSGGSSSSGSSSSENSTDTTVVRTKYSVSAAEAAATDGDTNTVSWTFE